MDFLKIAQISAIALVAAASLTACQRRDESATTGATGRGSTTAGTSGTTSPSGTTGGTTGTTSSGTTSSGTTGSADAASAPASR